MLRRGVDPFDYSVREMISVAESWFLSFFHPGEWAEVRERLESLISEPSTSTVPSVDGGAIPVTKAQEDELRELLAAAGAFQPEPEAESPEPS